MLRLNSLTVATVAKFISSQPLRIANNLNNRCVFYFYSLMHYFCKKYLTEILRQSRISMISILVRAPRVCKGAKGLIWFINQLRKLLYEFLTLKVTCSKCTIYKRKLYAGHKRFLTKQTNSIKQYKRNQRSCIVMNKNVNQFLLKSNVIYSCL